MVNPALTTAREDLIAAGKAYSEAKARGESIRERGMESHKALAEAEKKLIEARRASDAAFDQFVDGTIDRDEFTKRFAAVERAEEGLRAAQNLVQRWERCEETGRALDRLHRALGDAREVYAMAAMLAEIGIEDLRERLIRAFVLWSWGRRHPVQNMGSERGDLFLRFLPELFGKVNRDEVSRAREQVEKYFADLPEALQ
jgi:hypothetical protein